MEVLVLVTDAFGGHGGIAKFNRDLLKALSAYPECEKIVAIPRLASDFNETLPSNISFLTFATNNKLKYLLKTIWFVLNNRYFDIIVCGHINLIPIAYICKKIIGKPLVLIIHGVEAWESTKKYGANLFVKKIDAFIAVSEFTKKRFSKWSNVIKEKVYVLPNCVDLNFYKPGPQNLELLKLYGLKNKKILITLGRLVSKERCKGFDEVLEVLPELSIKIPEIVYLIVGSGDDFNRLAQKSNNLGVADRVVFAGYVNEEEKPDFYRLADVFVMPSRGEGFGIVLLEALACGIPVIASKADGSYEALKGGELGKVVNPGDKKELLNAICESLNQKKDVPIGLDYFSISNFNNRLYEIIKNIIYVKGKYV